MFGGGGGGGGSGSGWGGAIEQCCQYLRWMKGWFTNWRGFGRKQSCSNSRHYLGPWLEELRIMLATHGQDISAEIQISKRKVFSITIVLTSNIPANHSLKYSRIPLIDSHGPGRCQIIEYCILSDGTYSVLSSYK